MVSSLSIHNSPAPVGVPSGGAWKTGHEKPPEESRRLSADRGPQILDLETSRMLEQRLARRAARGVVQEGYGAQSRRAVSAYESLEANEERDRISEMLGIDLFA